MQSLRSDLVKVKTHFSKSNIKLIGYTRLRVGKFGNQKGCGMGGGGGVVWLSCFGNKGGGSIHDKGEGGCVNLTVMEGLKTNCRRSHILSTFLAGFVCLD